MKSICVTRTCTRSIPPHACVVALLTKSIWLNSKNTDTNAVPLETSVFSTTWY